MTIEDVELQPAAAAAPTPGGTGRAWLIGLGVTLAVLSVAFGALDVAGTLARQTLHRSAAYANVRAVDVEVGDEAVAVVSSSGNEVLLSRSVSYSLGRPHLSEKVEGDTLVVRSSCPVPFGRGCSGTLRLAVPASTRVRVHSSATSVRVSDLDGVLDLSSSAGSVVGTGLRSATVTADSSAGSVRLTFASAPSAVTATSSAGSVGVVVPRDDEGYRVDAGSSAGSTHVTVRTDSASSRRIRAHSSAGSVSVTYGS